MKRFSLIPSSLALLIAIAAIGTFAPAAKAQSAEGVGAALDNTLPYSSSRHGGHTQLDLTYRRPTGKAKLRNYFFDTFGPYPVAGAAILGAVNQSSNTPPEWGQGFQAYGERVGSNFGIAVVTTTTRYGLAAAFREDTIYYRCECKGIFRRLGHALISTVTARRGEDGHRRLSFPAIIAPYAGSMTAVYAWYPDRYTSKDGLRMGNYALLAFAAGNVAREFIYGGPHTLFSRVDRSPPSETDSAAITNP